jgi:ABC-2 type transport system ATP-binding protein
MEYVIETHDLTKKFTSSKGLIDLLNFSKRKEIIAIKDVNLKIKKGELFGILGPNGAGKTTLIKVLCTLILPTAGSASINGYDIIREEIQARSSLGYVTGDERSFYWRLTGRQNLEFFAGLNNIHNARTKVDEVFDFVELADKADDKFNTYSAGMKQKMAIARGLINDPEILFMDEPTSSLDPIAAQHLRTFIKEKLVEEQKKTIFLSTHNLDEAEHMCDRIAIMDRARIRACGTIKDIEKKIKNNETYILEVNELPEHVLKKLGEIEGISGLSMQVHSGIIILEIILSRTEVVLPEILDIIVNAGCKIRGCTAKKLALNQVFSKIVEKR